MKARVEEDAECYSLRVYVTDSLQAAGQGKYLTQRWCELLTQKVDNRSGDEIAADIILRAGLKPKGGEEE